MISKYALTAAAGIAGASALIGAGAGTAAWAQESQNLVVLELFTSQGCTACPPADDLIGELADRTDVIALALHVDYWDYIGWADTFAQHSFTERQHAYGHAAGSTVVYTPQMIVNGADRVVGYRPMDVADAIQAHRAAPQTVALRADPVEAGYAISAETTGPGGGDMADMVVQLVTFLPHRVVEITRGERAGTVSDHYNIVTGWQIVSEWDGTAPFAATVALDGDVDTDHVIIIQEAEVGPILAAARLD